MKRFFSTMLMLVAAFALVGCDTDDDGTTGGDDDGDQTMTVSGTEYSGTLTVEYQGETTFTQESTKFYLDESADKSTATLYATSVKFDSAMPVSLTIVALDVEAATAGSDYSYYVDFTESLSLSGLPQGNDLEELYIIVDGDDLTVTFDYNYSGSDYNVTFTTKETSSGNAPTIEITGDKYEGSLTFNSNTQDDITFYVDADGDSATLFIVDFVYYTGGTAQTIVIENIPVDVDGTYDYSSASGLNAVNQDGGAEQGTITNLTMNVDGDGLDVTFDLTISGGPGTTYTFEIDADMLQTPSDADTYDESNFTGTLTFNSTPQSNISFVVKEYHNSDEASLTIVDFVYYTGGTAQTIVISGIPYDGSTYDYSSASGLSAVNLDGVEQGTITNLTMDVDSDGLDVTFDLTISGGPGTTYTFEIDADYVSVDRG